MAACSTRVELERLMSDPLRNQKAIRATLNDRTAEAWALLALAEALSLAEPARFKVLKVVARPCLSKKRVASVCGSVSKEPWIQFFAKAGAAPKKAPVAAGSVRAARRSTAPAVKKAASGVAIPLRDAGTVVRSAMAANTAKKAGAGGKKPGKGKKGSADPYLEGVVQCRECLRSYKRIQLPNPRRRVCEDCGGQPESTSVRTISGGSPGLGRRR
jgi:hypothetical protein